MNRSLGLLGASALALLVLAGCGSGETGAPGAPPVVIAPPNAVAKDKIAAAATDPANDAATSTSSAFAVVQAAGIPAAQVPATGAARVNFAVFSDRGLRLGLNNANIRVAIAKLVPGSNGSIDEWQSYVYRTERTTGANAVGPGGTPVLAEALQANTESAAAGFIPPCGGAVTANCNVDGYYSYVFTTNLRDTAQTNGVSFDPAATHRIALQLAYTNAAGETVNVNPYFDVTFDASGNSVPVTDPARTRVMADVASCNGCHERLAIHGGGRVDVQFCVMCHNPKTTDANSGNVLTMQTMVHKIHAGRLLKRELDAGRGGEQYVIWGFNAGEHDYAEVGFPQDLRNCSVCHSAANPKTPQGDNWKTRPSKESCLTCHASGANSNFDNAHLQFAAVLVGPGAAGRDIDNANCAFCHRAGTEVSPERVHFNQNEENAARYKVVIDSAAYDAAGRKVTVTYALVDPTAGNAAYNLVTPDCTGTGAALTCGSNTRFGNLRFYLAYPNLVGQTQQVTEFTSFNNGGGSATAFLYKGTNNGSNRYTVDIPLPADTATAVAAGTARIVGTGQVKETKLLVQAATDPRPVDPSNTLVNVVVQHAAQDVVLSGALNPRRQVVANEKCNVCHGALGTTSGSNTLSEAFHSGARNTVEACVLCHDQNRVSSTVMTNGLALNENYGFKRMIHGIHGNSKRTAPFTHGNPVRGVFNKQGELQADGVFLKDYTIRGFTVSGAAPVVIAAATPVPAPATFETIEDLIFTAAQGLGYTGARSTIAIENYAAEVAYPQVGLNCNACHVNNSWQRDLGPVGAVVSATGTDPLNWLAISPRAATCTACHDSANAIAHVRGFGGSSFGERTQAQILAGQRESCVDCHEAGMRVGVDVVHRLR